jgi:hypothetical protein
MLRVKEQLSLCCTNFVERWFSATPNYIHLRLKSLYLLKNRIKIRWSFKDLSIHRDKQLEATLTFILCYDYNDYKF